MYWFFFKIIFINWWKYQFIHTQKYHLQISILKKMDLDHSKPVRSRSTYYTNWKWDVSLLQRLAGCIANVHRTDAGVALQPSPAIMLSINSPREPSTADSFADYVSDGNFTQKAERQTSEGYASCPSTREKRIGIELKRIRCRVYYSRKRCSLVAE